jgi:hypothetical protein
MRARRVFGRLTLAIAEETVGPDALTRPKRNAPAREGIGFRLGPNNEPAELLLIVHGLPTPFFKRRLFNVTRSRDD